MKELSSRKYLPFVRKIFVTYSFQIILVTKQVFSHKHFPFVRKFLHHLLVLSNFVTKHIFSCKINTFGYEITFIMQTLTFFWGNFFVTYWFHVFSATQWNGSNIFMTEKKKSSHILFFIHSFSPHIYFFSSIHLVMKFMFFSLTDNIW